MTTRRTFTFAALALAVAPALARSSAPALVVHKNAGCGCCGEWEKHMRAGGFRVESRVVPDLGAIKRALGVPDALASCHTGLIEGYVIEGHVPAPDVKRLLRERPKATGIAVPGMPMGAPGMEQGAPQPYATLAFDRQRSWVFEKH